MANINFEITAPDGSTFLVTVPETATRQELQEAVNAQMHYHTMKKSAQGYRQEAQDVYKRQAAQEGALGSFAIGAGKGLYNVGRGAAKELEGAFKGSIAGGKGDAISAALRMGADKQQDIGIPEAEKRSLQALKEQRPYSYGAGEIVGEAAPFLAPGLGVGGLASKGARVLASGGLGAAESALAAKGREGNVLAEGAMGAAFGAGAEALIPVVGKLAGKAVRNVLKRAPVEPLIDSAGRPSAELVQSLDALGMTFDDLVNEADSLVNKTGDAAQVARQKLFAEEGVDITKGQLTKDAKQVALEQQLLQNPEAAPSAPFQQQILQQSEQIKNRLKSMLPQDFAAGSTEALRRQGEEVGGVIKDALNNLEGSMRIDKNKFYKESAELLKNRPDVPLFVDAIQDVLPDEQRLRRLAIQDDALAKKLNGWLQEFQVVPSDNAAITEPLSLANFDVFRQGLNDMWRSSDAGKDVIRPIINALDFEVDNMVKSIGSAPNLSTSTESLAKLKAARKIVRQQKTWFSDKALAGKLTDVHKDGVTAITEASKVYDKITARSTPIEQTRRVVGLLKRSPNSEQALSSLQSTVLMDLINSGFSTESRRIRGQRVFNPIAFRKRMQAIGHDKIRAIFANNQDALKRMRNIETIAGELIPDSGAVPKGSSPMLVTLAEKLGLIALTSKVPGGRLLIEPALNLAQSAQTRADAQSALQAAVQLGDYEKWLSGTFPAIGRVLFPKAARAEED